MTVKDVTISKQYNAMFDTTSQVAVFFCYTKYSYSTANTNLHLASWLHLGLDDLSYIACPFISKLRLGVHVPYHDLVNDRPGDTSTDTDILPTFKTATKTEVIGLLVCGNWETRLQIIKVKSPTLSSLYAQTWDKACRVVHLRLKYNDIRILCVILTKVVTIDF